MTANGPISLLPQAARVCTETIARIPDGGWTAPSPCEGWSVRDVVNHLTAEHRWAPRLLAGETVAEVDDDYDGDLLGEAPVDAWRDAIAESLRAWASADRDGRVDTTSGGETVTDYANQMLIDLTVHAWDIAKGAGILAHLDPESVRQGLAYEGPRVEAGGVEGIFARPVDTDSDDPTDRLVALLGRDPGWRR